MGGSGFRPATSDQRLPPPAQKATVPKTPSSRCPYTVPQQHSTEFTLKSTSPKLQNSTTCIRASSCASATPAQPRTHHITHPRPPRRATPAQNEQPLRPRRRPRRPLQQLQPLLLTLERQEEGARIPLQQQQRWLRTARRIVARVRRLSWV
jgi:hypothetical protein